MVAALPIRPGQHQHAHIAHPSTEHTAKVVSFLFSVLLSPRFSPFLFVCTFRYFSESALVHAASSAFRSEAFSPSWSAFIAARNLES